MATRNCCTYILSNLKRFLRGEMLYSDTKNITILYTVCNALYFQDASTRSTFFMRHFMLQSLKRRDICVLTSTNKGYLVTLCIGRTKNDCSVKPNTRESRSSFSSASENLQFVFLKKIFSISFRTAVSSMHIITPPARRAWRSCKFAPFLFLFSFVNVESWATAHG